MVTKIQKIIKNVDKIYVKLIYLIYYSEWDILIVIQGMPLFVYRYNIIIFILQKVIIDVDDKGIK